MEALINLENCTEYIIIKINDIERVIKLEGTVDEPYFCGKDVCLLLGYQNKNRALQKYVDKEDKKTLRELNETRENIVSFKMLGTKIKNLEYHEGKSIYISEAGLYSLIMSSQIQFAKEFKKLVCKKILPSIRKYGSYTIEKKLTEVTERLNVKEQNEIQLQERLKNSEKYNIILKNIFIKSDHIVKTQVIYISTCNSYAQKNIFKIGGVETISHLKKRLSSYNSNRIKNDEWFFSDIFMVADYRNIEKRIEVLIGRFRDKKEKEILIMHYDDVKYVVKYLCENFDREINNINELMNTFIENLNPYYKKPVILLPLNTSLAAITKLTKDGKIQNEVIMSNNDIKFIKKIENYLLQLPSTRVSLSKKEIFDAINLKNGRRDKLQLLEKTIYKIRPDIKYIKKQCF